ncbi:MAG: metal-sulfur cluster assembly factor [Arcobacteraceae bacterium]|nr:metal-sulfur cluster assembly factor [Arcobacteraceae bacterium]
MYTKEEIFKAVSTVNDPEVGFNLVEMGLIYDATCDEKGDAKVVMTLSTKACPLHQMIVQWVEEAVLRELPKVENIEVEVVWEPVWNISMATEEVKQKLIG